MKHSCCKNAVYSTLRTEATVSTETLITHLPIYTASLPRKPLTASHNSQPYEF